MDNVFQKLNQQLNNKVMQNLPMSLHTTFKIGGPAKYFFAAQSEKDLVEALKIAKELEIKFFILGGGSNILVSDQGFDGLVIKMNLNNLNIMNNEVVAEAGVNLGNLIGQTAKNNLGGLEFLAGVPGTVGGAIYGNAGSPQIDISDFIKKVKVLDKNFNIVEINKDQCKFAYRQSRFKETKEIILSAVFEMKKGDRDQIQEKIKESLKKKKDSQPLEFPSAGSIFKNPKEKPAWQLIKEADLPGKKIGGAMISEKHANYIVNTENATAEQVIMLISLIKQKIRTQFNIQLQEEIQLVGF
jgi:UDP-N-acetylmuramate dehydrogenase